MATTVRFSSRVRKLKEGERLCYFMFWQTKSGKRKECSTDVKIPVKASKTAKQKAERQMSDLCQRQERKLKDAAKRRKAMRGVMTWDETRSKFETLHLSRKSKATQQHVKMTLDHFENMAGPQTMNDVDSEAVAEFAAALQKRTVKREVNGEIVDVPLRETSIATNLRNLRVFLRWAHNQGHIQKLPTFPKYKGTRSRGRGLNLEEFERLLQAARDMRPNDYPQWERFLKAIWHSGLRLGEALQLSWDEDSGFRLDLSQRIGRFQIQSASQKSRKSQEAPITPTFEAWMRETPVAERKGLVLPLVKPDGKPYSRQNVAKFIAAFGKKACILVDRELNKTATCHDLRKSFGSRLAPQLPSMEVLASLLRHASTQTTEQYYRHRSVERTANLLQQFCPANESVGLSNQISPSDESSTTQEPAETLGK